MSCFPGPGAGLKAWLEEVQLRKQARKTGHSCASRRSRNMSVKSLERGGVEISTVSAQAEIT